MAEHWIVALRLLNGVATLVVTGLIYLVYESDPGPERTRLLALLVAAVAWIAGDALLLFDPVRSAYQFVVNVDLVASSLVTLFLLLLVLEYTGRSELLRPPVVAGLSVEPVALTALVATNGSHGLVYSRTMGFGEFTQSVGPAFVAHAVYSYVLAIIALGLVLELAYLSPHVYRRQAIAIAVAIVTPLAGNALYLFGPSPVDLTPIGFTVTGTLLTYAVVDAGFLDLSPVARDVVLDTVGVAIVVLDREGRVVDVNSTARLLLDAEEQRVVGEPFSAVAAAWPTLVERIASTLPARSTRRFEVDPSNRAFEVRISPLPAARDRPDGAVVLLDDVTERKNRERKLQRQNERLEEFAGIVSHDLRGPLSVAKGNAHLLGETWEATYLENVERAHDRMETLIDDLLTLAREGAVVDEFEQVDVRDLAREAWSTTRTGDATLRVDDCPFIEADPRSVRQFLENLFSNAFDHGGDDVTVRVGWGDDGFYVEDDGPGVPPNQRERVFEPGSTADADGTGFGLSIVRRIAEAHGWEIRLVEGTSGGARFEITGVTRVS